MSSWMSGYVGLLLGIVIGWCWRVKIETANRSVKLSEPGPQEAERPDAPEHGGGNG